jgi:hypothetical protein
LFFLGKNQLEKNIVKKLDK